MGTAGIKIKIMPSSTEANLEEIKNNAKALIEQKAGKNCKFEEEPIAFGLKAVISCFEWPEEKELEKLQEELKKIKNDSSAEIIDMRRLL